MTFLPVVDRELRTSARKPVTYWTRVGYALFGIFVSSAFYFYSQNMPFASPATAGTGLFNTLGWLCYIFALTLGVRLTVNSITDEKRDGTLGLLFLTDLKGYDVALGKVAACGLTSGYALLSVVPILAIAILLGGIQIADLARVALSIGLGLCLALSIGLFSSTVSQRGHAAAGLSFLLLLVCLFGPFLYVMWETNQSARAGVLKTPDPYVMSLSPAFALGVSQAGFRNSGNAPEYWVSSGVAAVEVFLFLAATSALLPRVWQDRSQGRTKFTLGGFYKRVLEGGEPGKTRYRHRLLEINAYFWRSARRRFVPHAAVIMMGLVGTWVGVEIYREEYRDPAFLPILSFCSHGFAKLWASMAAVRAMVEDRRDNALELVLTTPLSIRDLCHAQLRFFLRQFGPIAALVLACDFLMISVTWQDLYFEREAGLLLFAGREVILVLDLVAIGYLGLWAGAVSPDLNRATGMVGSRILLLPWIIFLLVPLAMLLWHVDGLQEIGMTGTVLFYLFVSVVNSVVWMVRARNALERDLRITAAKPYSRGSWGWLRFLQSSLPKRGAQNLS